MAVGGQEGGQKAVVGSVAGPAVEEDYWGAVAAGAVVLEFESVYGGASHTGHCDLR
ncbi:hypothetical protein GCM10009534_13930 [Kribbella sandramycini]